MSEVEVICGVLLVVVMMVPVMGSGGHPCLWCPDSLDGRPCCNRGCCGAWLDYMGRSK